MPETIKIFILNGKPIVYGPKHLTLNVELIDGDKIRCESSMQKALEVWREETEGLVSFPQEEE